MHTALAFHATFTASIGKVGLLAPPVSVRLPKDCDDAELYNPAVPTSPSFPRETSMTIGMSWRIGESGG